MIKTTLTIEGMMCSMCESHMNTAIEKAFGVKKVTSSHAKKQTVVISEQPLDEEKLKEVVESCGFTFIQAKAEPYKKWNLFHK